MWLFRMEISEIFIPLLRVATAWEADYHARRLGDLNRSLQTKKSWNPSAARGGVGSDHGRAR